MDLVTTCKVQDDPKVPDADSNFQYRFLEQLMLQKHQHLQLLGAVKHSNTGFESTFPQNAQAPGWNSSEGTRTKVAKVPKNPQSARS